MKKKKISSLRRWIIKVGGRKKASEIIGVDFTTVRHWDNGRNFPRPAQMKRIREVSQKSVSFDELVDSWFDGEK